MEATPTINWETIREVSQPQPSFINAFTMHSPRRFRVVFPRMLRDMSARQRIECFRAVFVQFSGVTSLDLDYVIRNVKNFATMVRYISDANTVEVIAALAVHDVQAGLDASMGWMANDEFDDDQYGTWTDEDSDYPEWIPADSELKHVEERMRAFTQAIMRPLANRMVQLSPDGIHALTLLEWAELYEFARAPRERIEHINANTDPLTFHNASDVEPEYAFTGWDAVQNVMRTVWDGELAALRSASARMSALVLESHSLPLEVAQLIPTYIDGRDISNPYPTREELRASRLAAASSSAASAAPPRRARQRDSSDSSDDEKPKKKESRTRGKARK